MQKNIQENILVSVIIPIHNAGEWLERCLDTLMNQTLSAMEFICVLDCPTDGSDKTVESYAKFDKRFVILKNDVNVGVSVSRNKGLLVARGEYIGFSDHDDWRELDMYEYLYYVAKNENADVVLSDTYVEREAETEIISFNQTDTQLLLQSIVLPPTSSFCKNELVRSVWHSIYKRSFLQKNKISFLERKKYMEEDSLFNFQVFTKTQFVASINKPFYHWNLLREVNLVNYQAHTSFEVFTNYYGKIKEYLLSSLLLEKQEKQTILSQLLSAAFYLNFKQYKTLQLSDIVKLLKNDIFLLSPFFVKNVNDKKQSSYNFLKSNYLLVIKYTAFILKLKIKTLI